MLNGLSLFSGIGGLDVALSEYVRPVAYCEIDSYCQGVLLSRMADGSLDKSPIWDDISCFDGRPFIGSVDIVYGGFPCQDISVAGHGKGLEGERSGLFFEIVRLAKEIKPTFIFLENVPAITSRGGLRVVREITEMGYDCRWCVISAASVGALHRRERWFLLAHRISNGRGADSAGHELSPESEKLQRPDGQACSNNSETVCGDASHPPSLRRDERASERIHTEWQTGVDAQSGDFCSASNIRRTPPNTYGVRKSEREQEQQRQPLSANSSSDSPLFVDWENTEPPVCGVAHGLPHRVDRIRGLGNAVVPLQAKEAFEVLMGLK